MRLYAMVRDLDAMLCHGVCCKRYAWIDCNKMHETLDIVKVEKKVCIVLRPGLHVQFINKKC